MLPRRYRISQATRWSKYRRGALRVGELRSVGRAVQGSLVGRGSGTALALTVAGHWPVPPGPTRSRCRRSSDVDLSFEARYPLLGIAPRRRAMSVGRSGRGRDMGHGRGKSDGVHLLVGRDSSVLHWSFVDRAIHLVFQPPGIRPGQEVEIIVEATDPKDRRWAAQAVFRTDARCLVSLCAAPRLVRRHRRDGVPKLVTVWVTNGCIGVLRRTATQRALREVPATGSCRSRGAPSPGEQREPRASPHCDRPSGVSLRPGPDRVAAAGAGFALRRGPLRLQLRPRAGPGGDGAPGVRAVHVRGGAQ